jgi:hypothetical protein
VPELPSWPSLAGWELLTEPGGAKPAQPALRPRPPARPSGFRYPGGGERVLLPAAAAAQVSAAAAGRGQVRGSAGRWTGSVSGRRCPRRRLPARTAPPLPAAVLPCGPGTGQDAGRLSSGRFGEGRAGTGPGHSRRDARYLSGGGRGGPLLHRPLGSRKTTRHTGDLACAQVAG